VGWLVEARTHEHGRSGDGGSSLLRLLCACVEQVKALGVKDINNFAADDLYEAKNMKQVMICILALGKKCWSIEGYTGPCLGPPETETTARILKSVLHRGCVSYIYACIVHVRLHCHMVGISSYILCHIIIHTMSHQQGLAHMIHMVGM
jgi:hypothetical protein